MAKDYAAASSLAADDDARCETESVCASIQLSAGL